MEINKHGHQLISILADASHCLRLARHCARIPGGFPCPKLNGYNRNMIQWLNTLPRIQSTKEPILTLHLNTTGMVGTKPGVTLPGFKSSLFY